MLLMLVKDLDHRGQRLNPPSGRAGLCAALIMKAGWRCVTSQASLSFDFYRRAETAGRLHQGDACWTFHEVSGFFYSLKVL